MPHDAEIRRLVEQACVGYEQDLRAFLVGVLRDPHQAEDALQKAIVKAIQAAADVNPETIRGWLFQIALNEGREIKRQASRQNRLKRDFLEMVRPAVECESESGLEEILSKEKQMAVQAALRRLEPDYREVVVRRLQKGETFAVIAEKMNRPLGTVLTWMRRAMLQLKEMSELRGFEDEYGDR